MVKLVIISAPSGTGKGTIINYLLEQNIGLEFSISATSRPPRGQEVHGKEYYFISADEFRQKIENDEFVEYEEVYQDRFYGTLKSEIDRISQKGNAVIFDLDVVGAQRVKQQYAKSTLSIFIKPPSIEVLRQRLEARGTETKEHIEARLAKAEYELSFENKYDVVIVNDKLEQAKAETLQTIKDFLSK